MLKNYLVVAWRNLLRNKLYSFTNIIGLSIGISCCIIIFLFIQDELSYDKHHQNAPDIFRITEVLHLPKEMREQAGTSAPMAPAFKANFPEVKEALRIQHSGRILSYKDKKFYDLKLRYTDSSYFNVFTHKVLQGSLTNSLNKPYSLVLTESTAKKYFGNETAFGKTMMLSDTINMTVTAVIEDVKLNSHMHFDILMSRSTLNDINKATKKQFDEEQSNWFNNGMSSYLLLAKGTDPKKLEKKLSDYAHKLLADDRKESGIYYDFKLQPITDIHLKAKEKHDPAADTNSDIMYVYIFGAAAIFILLIACSNFINLSTARSINRSKEIGLRKVIGAAKKQLVLQFLGESLLFTLIAAIISCIIIAFCLPSFNTFTHKALSINVFSNLPLLLTFIVIVITSGILAGIYPAFLMSSFAPIKSLKGLVKHGWADIIMRKGLVVFQFTIAIVLIISSIFVLEQLKFMQNTKIGLNKDQVVQIELGQHGYLKRDLLLQELSKQNGVVLGSLSSFDYKDGIGNITLQPEGAADNEITSESVICVDENFLKTFQIPLAAGRDFSKQFAKDPTEAFIVNEAAVKAFGWENPEKAIGKKIDWGLGKKGKVIGVTKDFNFKSLHEKVTPLIIHILPDWFSFVSLRVKAGQLPQTLENINKTWKDIVPQSPLKYSFLDEEFSEFYKGEQNLQFILTLFTILSVFIACLGLFGLAAYTIKQRFKEIGVRRVLGASVENISILLSKDFIKLVVFSIALAGPLAWLFVYKWLQNFAFHINIGWGIFIVSAIISLFIAIVTVSLQAMKAARTNPVKSLRTE